MTQKGKFLISMVFLVHYLIFHSEKSHQLELSHTDCHTLVTGFKGEEGKRKVFHRVQYITAIERQTKMLVDGSERKE